MTNKEKVINVFDDAKELVWTDDDEYTVGYNNGLEAGKEIALAILKEQEAVEPRVSTAEQRCGHCNKVIEIDGWQSCPWCGKRIDWKGWWKKNGTRNQDS